MTAEMKSAKLIELVNDEHIFAKIIDADSKEAMKSVFAQNGLEMTLAEIDAFILMMNQQKSNDGELAESDLDNVAGGAIDAIWIFKMAFKGIKAGAKYAWNAGKWVANNIG